MAAREHLEEVVRGLGGQIERLTAQAAADGEAIRQASAAANALGQRVTVLENRLREGLPPAAARGAPRARERGRGVAPGPASRRSWTSTTSGSRTASGAPRSSCGTARRGTRSGSAGRARSPTSGAAGASSWASWRRAASRRSASTPRPRWWTRPAGRGSGPSRATCSPGSRRGRPGRSAGSCARTCVEHLWPADHMRFARLAAAALRPGGVVVVETPNPKSLIAGADQLPCDPTHLRPVFPETLAVHAGGRRLRGDGDRVPRPASPTSAAPRA